MALIMLKRLKIKFVFILTVIVLFFPVFASADVQGQQKSFFVESAYDVQSRTKILATLQRISENAYFYIENDWYKNLTEEKKSEVEQNLTNLAKEFDSKIYPTLTSTYGPEWRPGIDNDYHITVLFQQMKEGAAGYFRTQDEYQRVQAPDSNEREMVYLATKDLFSPMAKSYLAHEFTHLITFNQKDRLRGVEEETWLNEMRADYSPTLLGYNKDYQGSNLQQRVKQFIQVPSDSLTEWQEKGADYGVVNLFGHYLVEHYGINVLVDSLHSKKVGIPSINEALEKLSPKQSAPKDFSQVFTDWTIAVFLNNCALGNEYCYKDENLNNLRITPSLIFLPSTQMTSVYLNYATKQWAGHWYRIIGGGGEGVLNLEFEGQESVKFIVPYILCQGASVDYCKIDFLKLDKNQEADISFSDFGKEWTSLTLIPSIQSKIEGFDSVESLYGFSIRASIEFKNEEEKLIEVLKAQIAALKAKIAKVQAEIAAILEKRLASQRLTKNLHFGMRGPEVYLLQEFLKSQGQAIYPEGLVTGFFGNLTKQAVIRFQEKYAKDILFPLGLKKGTGFVGSRTRDEINQILSR